jgi:hypothetical protein
MHGSLVVHVETAGPVETHRPTPVSKQTGGDRDGIGPGLLRFLGWLAGLRPAGLKAGRKAWGEIGAKS